MTIDNPITCGAELAPALAMSGPVVIQAIVDPHEPPLPPKIAFEQAKHFADSLAKRIWHAGKIALTVLSDKVRESI